MFTGLLMFDEAAVHSMNQAEGLWSIIRRHDQLRLLKVEFRDYAPSPMYLGEDDATIHHNSLASHEF